MAKIILNIILVPKINITGAMIATIISYMIPTVINHKKIQGFFKVRVPIVRQSIIPIIGSIAMALIILLAKIPVNKLMERDFEAIVGEAFVAATNKSRKMER